MIIISLSPYFNNKVIIYIHIRLTTFYPNIIIGVYLALAFLNIHICKFCIDRESMQSPLSFVGEKYHHSKACHKDHEGWLGSNTGTCLHSGILLEERSLVAAIIVVTTTH